MTDEDGFLTARGLRVVFTLAMLAALVLIGMSADADTAREEPAGPVPTTTTTSTTTPPSSATSSTAAAPTSTTSKPPVSSTTTTPAPRVLRAEEVEWSVSSTVYCLDGRTASDTPVRPGIVAVSYEDWPRLRGTSWRVVAGPPEILGRTYRVEDKGPAADFDVWMGNRPDCPTWAHDIYGREPATVVPA